MLRIDYIGSKHRLVDWLIARMRESVEPDALEDAIFADLFAGTGAVSYRMRGIARAVITNDAEVYSATCAQACALSCATDACKREIARINAHLCAADAQQMRAGPITRIYSPASRHEDAAIERKFWTEDNARRIDFVRRHIARLERDGALDAAEIAFLRASLIVSADAVSNVPAVYGCFLKQFKTRAMAPLNIAAIHDTTAPPAQLSRATCSDVLAPDFLDNLDADVAYLDPPYNERQYSKNYFPLNVVARTDAEMLAANAQVREGITGIPTDCFISPFCRRSEAARAFDELIRRIRARWVFLSYSSDGIVAREKMQEILERYGTVRVFERQYQKFKSFEYNDASGGVIEFLFCLRKDAHVETVAEEAQH